ncbi:MAG: hypothetical protein HC924_11885 [Synechococcaceae cyanobacterium SM2_3_2]|nr:hypothetical protein [Synechococcaceae cyanobacterium SM2_3_2]
MRILEMVTGYVVEVGSRQGDWTPPQRQITVEVMGYEPQTYRASNLSGLKPIGMMEKLTPDNLTHLSASLFS